MKGEKREGKGRDFYNHSLFDSPLYKGISEDIGRDWAKNPSSVFFMTKLPSRHSKIGGAFITIYS